MSTRDTDVPAESDEEIFLEAADRLRIATDAESENRIEGLSAISFSELGEQWDNDIKKERTLDGRPALTINHTQTFCKRLENTLRQQRPRIKCHPVGDGASIDTAATVNGLIRHIETLSNASVAYDTGAKSAINIGWGYWRIVSEYIDEKSFDQELKIIPIRNTFVVYIDPASVMPAGEDQGWCFITEMMKRIEYRRKYPKADNCEWQSDGVGDMSLDWESKEELRLAEYFRIHEIADVLYQMNDGSTCLKSDLPRKQLRAAVGYDHALDDAGKPIQRDTTRRVVQWFRLNGKKIVDRKVLPGKYIPVIRCEGNVVDVNGRVKRFGMVKNMMDPQRMFNYWRTQQTERYALAPKAPWVAYEEVIEGHPEWHSANQKAYSVLVAKAAVDTNGNLLPLPQRTAPAPVEAGMAEAAQGAEHDLMSVAGMPQENPELASRVVGGNKYLQRRQGMQDLTHFQYYDNQTLAIMWTGIILLDLIPYYYDTKRMQRIIGDDGVPKVVELNAPQESEEGAENLAIQHIKNDMQVGRYDVVMDTGPGYATKLEEGAERMMELLNTPLGEKVTEVGSDLIVRNLDFAGASDLADRLVTTNPQGMDKAIEGLPKQAQTIIGSLQQQMQQKDQVIQHLQLEIKYKADIEKLKDDGQTKRTLIQTTGKAHDTEKKAETDDQNSRRDYEGWMQEVEVTNRTKLDVAEIQVAGSLLNTHVEAEHEKRAAAAAIKAGATDRKPNGANSAG